MQKKEPNYTTEELAAIKVPKLTIILFITFSAYIPSLIATIPLVTCAAALLSLVIVSNILLSVRIGHI
jgi:hypothetical protein